MIKYDLDLMQHAHAIVQGLICGGLVITHVWSAHVGRPPDHLAWDLSVRTSGNHHLTFAMEGDKIAQLVEAVDFDGRRLIHNKINAFGLLPVDEQTALEKIIMAAHAHVITA